MTCERAGRQGRRDGDGRRRAETEGRGLETGDEGKGGHRRERQRGRGRGEARGASDETDGKEHSTYRTRSICSKPTSACESRLEHSCLYLRTTEWPHSSRAAGGADDRSLRHLRRRRRRRRRTFHSSLARAGWSPPASSYMPPTSGESGPPPAAGSPASPPAGAAQRARGPSHPAATCLLHRRTALPSPVANPALEACVLASRTARRAQPGIRVLAQPSRRRWPGRRHSPSRSTTRSRHLATAWESTQPSPPRSPAWAP